MAVSELPGNPNAVWTVKTHSQGECLYCWIIVTFFFGPNEYLKFKFLLRFWKCATLLQVKLKGIVHTKLNVRNIICPY